MGNEFVRELVVFLFGGGVAATLQALYKIRSEKDSITVATSGQVLEMQQKMLNNLQKEIEDNRKECHDEMMVLREQCRVELETSQQEARLLIEGRDIRIAALTKSNEELTASLAALRRDFEEFRKNVTIQ